VRSLNMINARIFYLAWSSDVVLDHVSSGSRMTTCPHQRQISILVHRETIPTVPHTVMLLAFHVSCKSEWRSTNKHPILTILLLVACCDIDVHQEVMPTVVHTGTLFGFNAIWSSELQSTNEHTILTILLSLACCNTCSYCQPLCGLNTIYSPSQLATIYYSKTIHMYLSC